MKVDARRASIEPTSGGGGRSRGFEYRTERMQRDADLSRFASERWELVSVIADPCDPVMAIFYFKREK